MSDTKAPPLSPVLQQIGAIREQINQLAADPAVLEMVCAGGYCPDLKIGDAIEALDELAYAMSRFLQGKRISPPRPHTRKGVLRF